VRIHSHVLRRIRFRNGYDGGEGGIAHLKNEEKDERVAGKKRGDARGGVSGGDSIRGIVDLTRIKSEKEKGVASDSGHRENNLDPLSRTAGKLDQLNK